MCRILFLAASVAVVGGGLFLTSGTASAESDSGVTLFGMVDGVESDGSFPATVTVKEPVTGKVLGHTRTLVDITNGKYVAKLDIDGLKGGTTYEVDMEGLEAAEEFSMAGFVNLQDVTPGVAQTGHLNISGYVLAGRIGLGTSPTLARVQVSESGSIQGVRSITNTGTAVYGQATAGTGLAAGGYFTTSSVGGRAMVGDALSTTGSTVGGLFYNRSQAGVAVWGRHVNNSGASIGVFGQTASASGTAIMAENTGTGDTVEIASANGTLLTNGTLPRHQYSASTAANMVPIAYGSVTLSGTVFNAGSGNWSVTAAATGTYDVNITGITGTSTDFIAVANSDQQSGNEFVAWNEEPVTGDVRFLVWNVTSNALENSAFSFVIYRGETFNPPNMPAKTFSGSFEEWERKDPKGFEAYRQKRVKAQLDAMRVSPAVIPVDAAEPAGQSGAVIRPRK